MRKGLLAGVLVTVFGGVLVAALVIWSGIIDVSASAAAGPQDAVLAYASTRSLRRHAKPGPNPLANSSEARAHGLQHYRAMCVACHAGPGVEAAEFAAGLHPAAPDLASPQIQAFTDGMIYQAIAGGIGSTGMPAFGKSHTQDELWSLVAFVRALPKLTAEEKKALAEKDLGEPHEAAAPAPAAQPEKVTPTGEVHVVKISSFKFDPPALEVHLGDVVEWKNEDFVAHTATADDKSFDTGRIEAGETKRIVVSRKGASPYYCRYHLAMRGTITAQ